MSKWRTEQRAKRAKLEPSLRNPVDAWPGDLVFFFRVIFLLRGLCSALVCVCGAYIGISAWFCAVETPAFQATS